MIVYFKKNLKQRTVNHMLLTPSAFIEFKKAIEEKKVKAYIVGFELSLLN